MGHEERSSAERRRRRLHGKLCAYCGAEPATSEDHVPPQSLFPKPRIGLVKVPCCEGCRTEQSKDDEYFKNIIVLRHDVSSNPVVATVFESVQRALRREEGRGFTASLLASLKPAEIRSVAGLYLGRGATYNPDYERLDTVMRRTLLGLYFHETRVRLPDTHDARVLSVDGLPPLTREQETAVKHMIETALSGRLHLIGDRVFVYAFQQISRSPHVTVWVFQLYSRVGFIGFTFRREEDVPVTHEKERRR